MIIIFSLILLGIILLLVELLLTPGVGVAGILGLGAFGGASYYAWTTYGQSAGLITIAVLVVLVVIVLYLMLRSRTWHKLELGTVIDSHVNSDRDEMSVGAQGSTITRLAPMGKAMFGSSTCEVTSEGGEMIDPSTPVVVTRIESKRIFVKPL